MMKKTMFGLDSRILIMILSSICMLFTFLGRYCIINSFISFVFNIVKLLIFVLIPLMFYFCEKEDDKLKKIAGIYTSYFIINLIVTIISSLSFVDGQISFVWQSLFDLVNLIILLSCLFIFVEQLLDYNGANNKFYKGTIMKIVYKVGFLVSYPFIRFINSKINKNN